MPRRADFSQCYWCGFRLCHKCRNARDGKVAKCGGKNTQLCEDASTRDHLLPRRFKRSRKEHSGYKNNPPIVIACSWCNHNRSDLTVAEWLVKLADFTNRKALAVQMKLRSGEIPDLVP